MLVDEPVAAKRQPRQLCRRRGRRRRGFGAVGRTEREACKDDAFGARLARQPAPVARQPLDGRLFPADPPRRAVVEDAERWGEDLQNAVRRLSYCATRRTGASVLGTLGSFRHRASADAARADAATLPDRLAQIDAWIGAGILGGEELNAADFQIAPNVAVLLTFADFAPYIAGRPAAAHAVRVAGGSERHRGPVFPEEWLAPLRNAGV